MTAKSNCVWQFHHLRDLEPDDALTESMHKIFLDGFGLKEGWSIGGIKKALMRSTILGLLVDPKGNTWGYAMYTIPDEPLMGTYFLWEDAICLKKDAQGKGFSSIVWGMILSFYSNRKFGWVGGRTQNPLIIKRYSNFGTLFPFDFTYAQSDGKLIMDFLCQHIAEVRDVEYLKKETGICRRVYSEGRLGDYPIPSEKDILKFEKRLSDWNFQRENGDAIVVVAKVENPSGV